jgi:hypothetical protein
VPYTSTILRRHRFSVCDEVGDIAVWSLKRGKKMHDEAASSGVERDVEIEFRWCVVGS